MKSIQHLESEKEMAWREYQKLKAPADEAHSKYKQAAKEYNEAVLYEKAKRQVLRDLIKASGKTKP